MIFGEHADYFCSYHYNKFKISSFWEGTTFVTHHRIIRTSCFAEEWFTLRYLKIQSADPARICPHKLQLGIAAFYLNVDFLRQQFLFLLFSWQFIHLINGEESRWWRMENVNSYHVTKFSRYFSSIFLYLHPNNVRFIHETYFAKFLTVYFLFQLRSRHLESYVCRLP